METADTKVANDGEESHVEIATYVPDLVIPHYLRECVPKLKVPYRGLVDLFFCRPSMQMDTCDHNLVAKTSVTTDLVMLHFHRARQYP